jgi:nucleoside-diphosphate-sugar epimerase
LFFKISDHIDDKNEYGLIKMKSQTALVTGATGFVGSHLVRRLLAENWNVSIMIRPQSKLEGVKDCLEHLNILEHDGTTHHMMKIIGSLNLDVIFHLASLFLAEHHPRDIEPLIQSNILFGVQLVEAMARYGIYHLVNIGTSWQHYQNSDYSPVCLYAATKQAFEAILKFYVESTSLKVVTLKLCDTYGPGDFRNKLFGLLQRSSETQEPLMMSPGEQWMDLVYIDDVVEALLIAASRLQDQSIHSYEDFTVYSNKPVPLKKVIVIYESILGKKLPVHWGAKPYRAREVMFPWNRGRILPGWHPKVNLDEGMRRIIHAEQPRQRG